MESSQQLATRFREVILYGKRVANTNYKDQLSKVTWKEASTQIGSLNTLAALTFHVNYYTEGLVNLFENGKLEIRDKYSFDLPAIQSKEDWDKLLNDMWNSTEKFANHVEGMSDEKLEETFVDKRYGTYRRNIEGIIEHAYYHLGQISLIRKMLQETSV